jgi:hypothetical protein
VFVDTRLKLGLSASRDDVFFSFSFYDRRLVSQIKEIFDERALTTFADSGISLREGEDWQWYLGDKLMSARWVVVVWSSNARKSQSVLWEMRRANELQKLHLLRLDDTPLPSALILSEALGPRESEKRVTAAAVDPYVGLNSLRLAQRSEVQSTPKAAAELDNAVAVLRKSSRVDILPLALLARVAHRRRRAAAGETDLTDGILADLAEVEDIAGDEMRLHLTDLALERARLALDLPAAFASPEAARAEAEAQTATAAQLIADTGYHRRDGELAELKARLAAA